MSIGDTRVSRGTAIPGIEDPKYTLSRHRQILSKNQRPGRNRIDAKKETPLLTGSETMRDVSFWAFAGLIVSKERPVNVEAAPNAHLMSE